jgi:hypothetical protein
MGWASRLSSLAKLEARKAELRQIGRGLGSEAAINRYLSSSRLSPRQRVAFHALMMDGLDPEWRDAPLPAPPPTPIRTIQWPAGVPFRG